MNAGNVFNPLSSDYQPNNPNNLDNNNNGNNQSILFQANNQHLDLEIQQNQSSILTIDKLKNILENKHHIPKFIKELLLSCAQLLLSLDKEIGRLTPNQVFELKVATRGVVIHLLRIASNNFAYSQRATSYEDEILVIAKLEKLKQHKTLENISCGKYMQNLFNSSQPKIFNEHLTRFDKIAREILHIARPQYEFVKDGVLYTSMIFGFSLLFDIIHDHMGESPNESMTQFSLKMEIVMFFFLVAGIVRIRECLRQSRLEYLLISGTRCNTRRFNSLLTIVNTILTPVNQQVQTQINNAINDL